MSSKIEEIWKYCQANRRVCPMPNAWNDLFNLLPNKERDGAASVPAFPLILAAWHHATPMQKMLRLREHLEWANTHGIIDTVEKFLQELDESQWFHIGD